MRVPSASASSPSAGAVYNEGDWQRWEPPRHDEKKQEDMTDRAWAKAFYVSPQWIKCRTAYAKSKGNLCERCSERGLIVPGEEVHHKIRLTPKNVRDPSVALNWDNLELLCKRCHLEEHHQVEWRTDEGGHVNLEAI